jgi:hypothetical protein
MRRLAAAAFSFSTQAYSSHVASIK